MPTARGFCFLLTAAWIIYIFLVFREIRLILAAALRNSRSVNCVAVWLANGTVQAEYGIYENWRVPSQRGYDPA